MRRFDKKKNIKLLNERINKKPTSLTENSWADALETDAFPEEFSGLYDDDVLGDDPHGEHLYGDGPQHWTDKHGETVIDPSDFDSAFDSEQRAMQMDSGYGLEGGSEEMFDGPMETEAEGGYDEFPSLDDLGGMDFPHEDFDDPLAEDSGEDYAKRWKKSVDSQWEPADGTEEEYGDDDDFRRWIRQNIRGEGVQKGKRMNVLSEQSLRAFDRLCGVKLIKEGSEPVAFEMADGSTVNGTYKVDVYGPNKMPVVVVQTQDQPQPSYIYINDSGEGGRYLMTGRKKGPASEVNGNQVTNMLYDLHQDWKNRGQQGVNN